jgi:1-acyl-sn-glycerol-3-phosphate acyltransferase
VPAGFRPSGGAPCRTLRTVHEGRCTPRTLEAGFAPGIRLAPVDGMTLHERYLAGLRWTLRALVDVAYRFRVEGLGNLPDGPAVLVCNHAAFHDWVFIACALPRAPRFVMHRAHFANPLLRPFFLAGRVIPIAPRREAPEVLDAAVEAIDQALADGDWVVLYPEGRMTADGALGPFRPGYRRAVARRPAPVVPLALSGLWGSWFSFAHGPPMTGWPRRLRAPVTLRIGRPLPPGEAHRAPEAVRELLGLTAPAGPMRTAPLPRAA